MPANLSLWCILLHPLCTEAYLFVGRKPSQASEHTICEHQGLGSSIHLMMNSNDRVSFLLLLEQVSSSGRVRGRFKCFNERVGVDLETGIAGSWV